MKETSHEKAAGPALETKPAFGKAFCEKEKL
jgi:hypothetical protein